MIYLDSSALLKLLFEEAESAALQSWLSERADVPKLSSELAVVEVPRASRRIDRRVVPAARTLVAQLDLVALTSALLAEAADVGPDTLRSLDAIHLVSGRSVGSELTAFVAYDARLSVAAQAAGLPLVRPGP